MESRQQPNSVPSRARPQPYHQQPFKLHDERRGRDLSKRQKHTRQKHRPRQPRHTVRSIVVFLQRFSPSFPQTTTLETIQLSDETTTLGQASLLDTSCGTRMAESLTMVDTDCRAIMEYDDSVARTALQPRLKNDSDNTAETRQEQEFRDDHDDANDATASSSSSQPVGDRPDKNNDKKKNNNNSDDDDDFSDEMLRLKLGRAMEPWDLNVLACTLDELSSFFFEEGSSSNSNDNNWEVSHAPSMTLMMVGATMVGRGF
jgi:hypothetical protein